MDIVRTCAKLEQSDNLHLARIIILLDVFAGDDGTGKVDGLTKLAKLDFLLRYPAFLERALLARKKDPSRAQVADFERRSIESRMIRFKYGPWDHRYRRLLNTLAGKGLVTLERDGSNTSFRISEAGRSVAGELAGNQTFEQVVQRARILRSTFDQSGTWLMKFVYETFPEIVSLRYNAEI